VEKSDLAVGRNGGKSFTSGWYPRGYATVPGNAFPRGETVRVYDLRRYDYRRFQGVRGSRTPREHDKTASGSHPIRRGWPRDLIDARMASVPIPGRRYHYFAIKSGTFATLDAIYARAPPPNRARPLCVVIERAEIR